MSVEIYVEDLIERQDSRSREGAPGVGMEEVDCVLDALSEGSETYPALLTPEAYARARASMESATDVLPHCPEYPA